MEPICIDSDDDVHAPGSGPARDGNQNGAAVATRHSTRSNRFLSTTQVFKVVLQLLRLNDTRPPLMVSHNIGQLLLRCHLLEKLD